MDDLKDLMQENYIKYASYVILERAIPDALDGLKPVQRRILHALRRMHDGKLHKVANVVGQTMPFHPHGDAPIYEALVNIANKELLLERQGNFGNPHTGDPAAAARYIETRLLPLALETMFNPRLTMMTPSYDGRSEEPVRLPAKIPLLLLTGAEGIAVGMSTRIFPHNFCEVIRAEISHIQGESYELIPDFLSGGSIDISEYKDGQGKIRVRAKIDVEDDKTLRIREICYSTTTESVIQSIDEAAKKGKIRIESIHDYTAEQVDIEIKIPRGYHSEQVREALFALTLCEVPLTASSVVIYQDAPCEVAISQIIAWHSDYLMDILKKELEIEHSDLCEEIHFKSLERVFIENKLYRNLEKVKKEDHLRTQVLDDLAPFVKEFLREPTPGDADRLLALPMRRISRFDLDANLDATQSMQKKCKELERKLKHMKATTIDYLESLIKRFGESSPRHTLIENFQTVRAAAVDLRKCKVGVDYESGFVGSKVTTGHTFDARLQDKLLVIFDDGSLQVISIEEKTYLKQEKKNPIHVQVQSKESTFMAIYTSKRHEGLYAKRFQVDKFIMQRLYPFLAEDETLKVFSADLPQKVRLKLAPTARKKAETVEELLTQVPTKAMKVRGVRLTDRKVLNVQLVENKA